MIETMRMTKIYTKERASKDKSISAAHSATVNHGISEHPPENALYQLREHSRKGLIPNGVTLLPTDALQGDSPGQNSPESLPQWLANTFATLPRKHPLRSLLQKGAHELDPPETHQSSDSTAEDIVGSSPEFDKSPFVFNMTDAPTSPSTLVASGTYTDPGVDKSKPGPCGLRTTPRKQVTRNQSVGDPSETEAFESPHFQPFTTPGPASTVSRPFVPRPIAMTGLNINMLPSLELPTYEDEVYGGEELISGLPIEDESDALQEEQRACFAGSAGLGHHIVWSEYDNLPEARDGNSATGFSELFQPGVGIYKHPYIVSPIEGWLNSDPPLESYVLDVEDLDFHWKAFDRKDLHQQGPTQVPCTPSIYELEDVEPKLSMDVEIDPQEGCNSPSSDGDRFCFQATLNKARSVSPAYASRIREAFAPTQGIYISPLKGSISGSGNLNVLYTRQGSQCSRDSIESWSD